MSLHEIYRLEQIQPTERVWVGDKAAILSQLAQKDYPVFPSVVISSHVLNEFLERLDDSESLLADFPTSSIHVNVDNPQALQLVARQARQAIWKQALAEEVRTSISEALNHLPGDHLILRASLNISSLSNLDFRGLLPAQVCSKETQSWELAIKTLWAELFSARSLFYWQRMGIGLEQIRLAVIVQNLEKAIASGTAQISPDGFEIQGNWGLGYSLLNGEVLPDIYEIQYPKTIRRQQLGNKTRAYRLQKAPPWLQVYLLSEYEQKNYCLELPYLDNLIHLLQQLTSEFPNTNFVEWVLTSFPDNLEPKFYINQLDLNLNPLPVSSNNRLSLTTNDSPLLRGIAASPGIAVSAVHVITEIPASFPSQPSILVLKSLAPEFLRLVKGATGIITEIGGLTSHAAIIARELGIPAIVNAKEATSILKTGDVICLDGNKGEVYYSTLEEGPKLMKTQTSSFEISYPIATQLMVNLSQKSSLESAAQLPVDGVGLLRSELMLLDLFSPNSLEDYLSSAEQSALIANWSDLILEFAQKFAPRPIFYRSLDWLGYRQSINPLSAKRGTYYYQLEPRLFDLELQALKQVYQKGFHNVNLLLPFVRSLEELHFCRKHIEQMGLLQYRSFQIWMMAEVPSVIFLLPQYIAAGVQGITIGTNDLTQLLLGVERDDGELNREFNPTHPAMLSAIKQLVTQSKQGGIPCSICGQACVDFPEIIDYLIQWGITAISVEADAVESTYRHIARAEKRILLSISATEA